MYMKSNMHFTHIIVRKASSWEDGDLLTTSNAKRISQSLKIFLHPLLCMMKQTLQVREAKILGHSYLFMVSMAEIPVWIISLGYILDHGLIGWPTKFQTAELVSFPHFLLINWVHCLLHFSFTLNVQKVLCHYSWAFINSLPRAIEYTTCIQINNRNQNEPHRSSWCTNT